MAVDGAAAVAGYVFDHRQDAASDQTLAGRPPEGGDTRWLRAVGAVADHCIGIGRGQIEDGQAVDSDAQWSEICGDETPDEARRVRRLGAQPSNLRGGGIAPPMRRAQSRDAAALLIDQNGGIRTADAGTQIVDQTVQLRRIDAITLKEN